MIERLLHHTESDHVVCCDDGRRAQRVTCELASHGDPRGMPGSRAEYRLEATQSELTGEIAGYLAAAITALVEN